MTTDRELVVVYGGPSAEHEISCISALRVAAAALKNGRTVRAVGLTHDKQWVDANAALADLADWDTLPSPDDVLAADAGTALPGLGAALSDRSIVFPVLHGPFGEDGVVQGHLEALGVPYVGAGVLSSAICMDKGISKSVLHDHGIPVADWAMVRRDEMEGPAVVEAAANLGYPLFVKPANLGSSIGVTKVAAVDALAGALRAAFEFDDFVILEELVAGRELELALLGNEEVRVSVAGEIVASRDFYDFEDKYLLGVAKTIVPMELTAAQLAQAQSLAVRAYQALRVEGLARVDMFLVGDDGFVVNEVNTMPGFTPISVFPAAWEAAGLPFGQLIEELLGLAVSRYERRGGLRTHR